MKRTAPNFCLLLLALGLPVVPTRSTQAADASRGLWVGEITMSQVAYVGETDSIDGAGSPLPTPTADAAKLRVILHVNRGGQVQLLKDVALLRRTDGLEERDVGLITDESLYQNYFPVGRRIAAAAFDFGDASSIDLLEAVVQAAGNKAASKALAGDTEASASTDAETDARVIIDGADVDASFRTYLQTDFVSAAQAEAIARAVAGLVIDDGKMATDFAIPGSGAYAPLSMAAATERSAFNDAFAAANALRSASVYGDSRGREALEALLVRAANATLASAGDRAAKEAAAVSAGLNVFYGASDFPMAYALFVAGAPFRAATGFAVTEATKAAVAEKTAGGDSASIRTRAEGAIIAVNASGVAPVIVARTEAQRIKLESLNNDPRGESALESVLDAIVTAAVARADAGEGLSQVANAAELARRQAAEKIEPALSLAATPVPGYQGFIESATFQNSAKVAADAAAEEAVRLYDGGGGQTDLADLSNDARAAARRSLATAFGQAAGVRRSTVNLGGSLGVGSNVSGEFMLPGNHPTNPFRHFRHSGHTSGYDITRKVNFAFDSASAGESLARGGYGVDRISGVFDEEISGLHKPLGSDPGNSPVGIRVRGTFNLDRISYVDTLDVP